MKQDEEREEFRAGLIELYRSWSIEAQACKNAEFKAWRESGTTMPWRWNPPEDNTGE